MLPQRSIALFGSWKLFTMHPILVVTARQTGTSMAMPQSPVQHCGAISNICFYKLTIVQDLKKAVGVVVVENTARVHAERPGRDSHEGI